MHKEKIIILCLGILAFGPVQAETLYDADTALKSGDGVRALKILDSLSGVFPGNSVEGGQRLLKKSEALLSLERTDEAETVLKQIPGTPGMPIEIVREAKLRRIRILKTKAPRDAREAAKSWLADNPRGEDAASVRLLLAELLRRENSLEAALEVLVGRPMDSRKEAYDAPLAEAEKRLRLAIRTKEKSAEITSPSLTQRFEKLLKDAETLRKTSAKKAADAYGKIVTEISAPMALRHRAAMAQTECLDETGDSRAALEASRFLADFSGTAPAIQIASGRITAARLALDIGENPMRARSLAEDAVAVVLPESDEADEARWLIARAMVRQKRPESEIREALADSPLAKNSPHPKGDPRHPVNRLIAAGGSLSKWIENDLHQSGPSGTNALLRAADEYFAATRYTEAAKRYAKAETFGSPGAEVRAYAALQQARAVALSPDFAKAPALYRRFITEKPLAKSVYAPGALLRAGTCCDGRLRDAKQAREFFKLGYDTYPDTEPGQACLIFLAENHADSGNRKTAVTLYEAYLKKYPSGHHTGTAKNFLNELKSKKK